MITGISKDKHGFADYVYVPMVLAAPTLGDFEDDKVVVNIFRATALVVLSYTVLTDAKWGGIKIIPYKTHLALDLGLGVTTLAASCLLKRPSRQARRALFLMGLTGIVVGTLSLIGAKKVNA